MKFGVTRTEEAREMRSTLHHSPARNHSLWYKQWSRWGFLYITFFLISFEVTNISVLDSFDFMEFEVYSFLRLGTNAKDGDKMVHRYIFCILFLRVFRDSNMRSLNRHSGKYGSSWYWSYKRLIQLWITGAMVQVKAADLLFEHRDQGERLGEARGYWNCSLADCSRERGPGLSPSRQTRWLSSPFIMETGCH